MTDREIHRILLGRTLAHLRDVMKLSQGDIARRADIPQSTLSRMETGVAPVEWYDLECMLRGMKHPKMTSPERLIGYLCLLRNRMGKLSQTLKLPAEEHWSEEHIDAVFRLAVLEPEEIRT